MLSMPFYNYETRISFLWRHQQGQRSSFVPYNLPIQPSQFCFHAVGPTLSWSHPKVIFDTDHLNFDSNIWDEVVMYLQYCIDTVTSTRRDLIRIRRHFGGNHYCSLKTFNKFILVLKASNKHKHFMCKSNKDVFPVQIISDITIYQKYVTDRALKRWQCRKSRSRFLKFL